MKEYIEEEAVKLMAGTLAEDRRDEDSIYEVLDLIFDYYDENGDLDIDFNEDDEDTEDDVQEIVAYICHAFRKNPPETIFSEEELFALVRAEIAYEETLI